VGLPIFPKRNLWRPSPGVPAPAPLASRPLFSSIFFYLPLYGMDINWYANFILRRVRELGVLGA